MNIAVSDLFCQGLATPQLKEVPSDVGVEVFIECGNDYYWQHMLPVILKDRTGGLSIHGPFMNLDLADPTADFEEIKEAFRWTFEYCKQFGARDCVCHPYGNLHCGKADDETCRQTSLERILVLNEMANSYGVTMLVEDMPEPDGLLNQQQFIDLFKPHEELNFLIDLGHAHLQNWDMDLAFRELGDRIKGYHVNDNMGFSDSHLMAWEGTFDWENFFKGYVKYTPEASLVCEYNFGPVSKVMESVEKIRDYIYNLKNQSV